MADRDRDHDKRLARELVLRRLQAGETLGELEVGRVQNLHGDQEDEAALRRRGRHIIAELRRAGHRIMSGVGRGSRGYSLRRAREEELFTVAVEGT